MNFRYSRLGTGYPCSSCRRGLVGSVLAKEGCVPSVSDLCSGAYKIFFKQLKRDDSTKSSPKPKYDSLMEQVDGLRKELDQVLKNRTITIVTGNRSGSGKYVATVIVVVVGYGYVWWKGWKISDMMFATRRGLNDACASVAKRLEDVYSSISATKKHLSSRIECVDYKIDECVDNTAATRDEVSELRGDVKLIDVDVQSVHNAVQVLETKLSRIEVRQNVTNFGVEKLVAFASGLENSKIVEPIEGAASTPALELPKVFPSRVAPLPPNTSFEPPSPATSNEAHNKQASFTASTSSQSPVSTSGLKDLGGICDDGVGTSSLSPPQVSISKGSNSSEESPNNGNLSSSSRVIGRTFSRFGFLSRSRSEVQSSTSSMVTPKPPVVTRTYTS